LQQQHVLDIDDTIRRVCRVEVTVGILKIGRDNPVEYDA